MFLKSIRLSLTLWYSLTLAVILVLFSSFLYLTIRTQLYSELDHELLAIAEAVASPTMEPFRAVPSSVMDQVLEDFIGPKISGKFVQLSDKQGKAVAHSKLLRQFPLDMKRSVLRAAEHGETTYQTVKPPNSLPLRIVAVPVLSSAGLNEIVQVGAPLTEAMATLDKMLLMFAISIPVAILLLSSGGWFLAGRALKPVDLLTRSAQQISAENLSFRLQVVNPNDEIGRLAKTFNGTLDRLEQAFRRMRQFSIDVSHELRTPLTILRGETEWGLRSDRDSEKLKEILSSNLEEIDRMSEIIGYLLDLSRVEDGELVLNREDVELNQLINDIVFQNMPRATEKAIALNFTGSAAVIVKGDHYRLRQIFANLLDNALKFTPTGGTITLHLERDRDLAKLSVTDSGPGIPAEDAPYIFDRFYRVDKARNRRDGGIGLGLSLVNSLALIHGGRIELKTELGKGSTFTVFLPILQSGQHE